MHAKMDPRPAFWVRHWTFPNSVRPHNTFNRYTEILYCTSWEILDLCTHTFTSVHGCRWVSGGGGRRSHMYCFTSRTAKMKLRRWSNRFSLRVYQCTKYEKKYSPKNQSWILGENFLKRHLQPKTPGPQYSDVGLYTFGLLLNDQSKRALCSPCNCGQASALAGYNCLIATDEQI